jgi:hypothetical protein
MNNLIILNIGPIIEPLELLGFIAIGLGIVSLREILSVVIKRTVFNS